tara:strand:- start:59 stop:346 length:288 start_codon:yes stop_codon:yes gene_type:complete
MSKIYLTNAVARTLDITPSKAEGYVSTVLDSVKQELKNKGKVIIRGFGVFNTRKKHERIGRNPRTGESAPIKARQVVTFKAAKLFKDKVNQGKRS